MFLWATNIFGPFSRKIKTLNLLQSLIYSPANNLKFTKQYYWELVFLSMSYLLPCFTRLMCKSWTHYKQTGISVKLVPTSGSNMKLHAPHIMFEWSILTESWTHRLCFRLWTNGLVVNIPLNKLFFHSILDGGYQDRWKPIKPLHKTLLLLLQAISFTSQSSSEHSRDFAAWP